MGKLIAKARRLPGGKARVDLSLAGEFLARDYRKPRIPSNVRAIKTLSNLPVPILARLLLDLKRSVPNVPDTLVWHRKVDAALRKKTSERGRLAELVFRAGFFKKRG